MTREKKIEALADEIYPALHPAWDGEQRTAYVDGILAGLRLRDEELNVEHLVRKLETYLKIYTGDKELKQFINILKQK